MCMKVTAEVEIKRTCVVKKSHLPICLFSLLKLC